MHPERIDLFVQSYEDGTFPADPVAELLWEDDHARAADRGAAARVPPRRVLVVDDNRDAADMLALALQQAGYEVEVAYDGPAALARAAAAPPQCAVVDIGLPVMDGWELAARLRASQPPNALRLVAVTGYGQEGDREKSRRAGFDAHLVKPLELDAILREIEPTGAGSAPP
jgi:CheY-like chemotaxis protein